MNNYNPVYSMASNVLLGFEKEIRSFLSPSDQYNLSRSNWWLYYSARKTKTSRHASWPTNAQFLILTQHLHAQLIRGRVSRYTHKKKAKAQLSVRQVGVLLRDLMPVALGLRPSCLVDCCALTKELAELLLNSLANEITSSQHWLDVKQLHAVLLDGNIFFVNVEAFVRGKMVELATGQNEPMYVDVSASLYLPRLISSRSETGVERLKVFRDWIVSACRNLLTSTCSQVLEWKRPSTLNATALAGILLCYPCVYDIFEDNNITKDDDWSEQENCLAMCPLYLFQIKALISSEQMEIALQEFSVPQHLLDTDLENEAKTHHVSPLVTLLQAHCHLKLQRAIERSCLRSIDVRLQVHVDSRMLHRVAL